MNFVFSGNKITAPSPQVLRCPYVYGCALGLEYGPTWKTCTHDANEEERKDIGRGGRVSFTSNFGRTFFCRRQCCDMLHWNVAVVCRSFKPITRRSLSVLSITFVIVVVSVPVQGIFFMKKHTFEAARHNRTNQASSFVQEIGYVGDCVPQLRRVAIFISVSFHYNGFLEDLCTMGSNTHESSQH